MDMNHASNPPTTIEGIKVLAKQIKKAYGMKHAAALEAASSMAGYASYHAARSDLIPKEGGQHEQR